MVINMIYFIVILAAIVIAAFLIPIKVDIYAKLIGDNVYYVDNLNKKDDVTIVIKILGFIPVYKYNKNKKNSKDLEDESNDNKLTLTEIINVLKESVSKEQIKLTDLTKKLYKWGKRVKFHKFVLVGGFNTQDYVKNAYINASINSIICMYINANQDNFNFKKLYYQVSISDYEYYLTLDIILSFPVINNIDVLKTIISIIHGFKKKKHEKEQCSSNIQESNNHFKMERKYDIT